MKVKIKSFGFIFILFVSSNVFAVCDTEAHRAFDFWIGDWLVTTASDNIVRTNKITKINNGCTLLEEYSTPAGYVGKSLNIYDTTRNEWHQPWTDSSGLLLKLNGGMQGVSMVMQGIGHDRNNNEILNKISWTPNADGTIRQHWEVSSDSGKNWKTVFDGRYSRSQ